MHVMKSVSHQKPRCMAKLSRIPYAIPTPTATKSTASNSNGKKKIKKKGYLFIILQLLVAIWLNIQINHSTTRYFFYQVLLTIKV